MGWAYAAAAAAAAASAFEKTSAKSTSLLSVRIVQRLTKRLVRGCVNFHLAHA